jgi:carbon monoxide dehydrogenase subunit G
MSKQKVQTSVNINNTPEAVMAYIADLKKRSLYLPSLKAVEDVKGGPGAGATWKWTWVLLGVEFQGTGRCLEYQPGKHYSFVTEGGLQSTWTYKAAPDGAGTKLTIDVEYTPPQGLLPRLRGDSHKAEVEQVSQNLKTILDN